MTDNAARVSAGRLGVWVAPSTAAVGVVSLVVSVSTPVRSGPWCNDGCVAYPYTDVAAFVPRDYLWIYPEVLLTLLFVVLAACLLHWVPPQRRLSAAVAVCFAVIGAAVLVVDYGIQLTVLQPAVLSGQTEGLSALTMYDPRGVFIALENVGYAVFGVAFVFLGGALAGASSRRERAVHWVFIVGGVLILAALVLSAAIYRADLDYWFELMSLSITWLVLIVSGTLLTVVFGRGRKVATQHPPAVTTDALAGR